MTTIDWSEYIETMVVGVKQYLIKDRMEDIDKARWQIKRSVNISNNIISFVTLLTLGKTFQTISFHW